MKIAVKGPLVSIKGTSKNNPAYEIIINTQKIVKDAFGCLDINASRPDDLVQRVICKVYRKKDRKECNIEIWCTSYEETSQVVNTIMKTVEAYS
jgi:hypothetical protein